MKDLLKKLFIRIVCADFIGLILRKHFNDKVPFNYGKKTFYINTNKFVSNEICARLFWGLYERHEVSLLKEFFPSSSSEWVIELGSSLGVLTNLILTERPNCKLLAVEANPFIFNLLKKNVDNNLVHRVSFMNAAISDSTKKLSFSIDNNSLSSTIKSVADIESSHLEVSVPAMQLSDLQILKDDLPFHLFSDIEGAEIYFLEKKSMLNNCKSILIELHSTSYKGTAYSVNDLVSVINQLGFDLIKKSARACYFERK